MFRKLQVFISSTADLHKWRTAAAKTLSELEIDESMFENWPSSPNDPIDECLKHVEESDAFILIMGERYGSLTSSGISVTHAEYEKAQACHGSATLTPLVKGLTPLL